MEYKCFLQGFAFSLVLPSCLCCSPGCLRRSKGLLEQMLDYLGSAGTSAPFVVCATVTWLAAAGGSPQRCCCPVKMLFFSFKEMLWSVLISVAVTELFFFFHDCPRSCSHCLTPTFLVACQTPVFVISIKDVGTVIPFLQEW